MPSSSIELELGSPGTKQNTVDGGRPPARVKRAARGAMAEEIDWIALQSLKMAQEAEDDAAERRYSEEEELLCKGLARCLRDLSKAKREEGGGGDFVASCGYD